MPEMAVKSILSIVCRHAVTPNFYIVVGVGGSSTATKLLVCVIELGTMNEY